ncbi:MAG: PIN domain-containing protein [Cyanobacteria bacterium J06634_5]
MKILYDTSVLVPAVVTTHPNHALSLPQLENALRKDVLGFLSAHTLAELYSVATRLPVPHRVSPSNAQTIIKNLLGYLRVVALSAEDYQSVIAKMTALQLPGGVIFDALIAQAALNAKVDYL